MKLSRILPLAVGGALASIVVSGTSSAQALTYTFSFSNVDGPVGGTVSGTIVLPDGDGTFAATSITINSAPAALGYTLPLDVLTTMPDIVENFFTVVGGTIDPINSSYVSRNANEAFILNSPDFGNLLSVQGANDAGSGVLDTNNATLTYSSAAVPFDIPGGATIPTVGSLFALTLMRKAKKRLAAKRPRC